MEIKKVFEGTVKGVKSLFLAEANTLQKIADVPAGQSAGEVAKTVSAEIIARSKANHEAVKALMKAWVAGQKETSPTWLAKAQAKTDAKEAKKAEAEKVKLDKANAKAAKSKADAEAAKKAIK